MKMYNFSAQIAVSGAVEAASLAEAERIIEGVLSKGNDLTLNECDGSGNVFDELSCTVTGYTRGRIRAET